MVVDESIAQAQEQIGKSQIVSYSSRFVDKLSDVTDSMNISGSLSIKYGAIGGSGSGSFIDSDKFKDSDLNFFITVKVVNQTINKKDVLKFRPIDNLDPNKFTQVFGDCFISGFLEGGEFNALISMKVLNHEKATDIKAAAKVALTVGAAEIGAEANVDVAKSNLQKNTETTISVNWSGGGKLKGEDVLWDIDSVTAVASKFADLVRDAPQRTYAILTKYTASRSFQEQAANFRPLDYENAGVYTSALLDAYMDYKSIWKGIQVASFEVDNGRGSLLPPNAETDPSMMPKPKNYTGSEIKTFEATLLGLDDSRQACRLQMIAIVKEVDEITEKPQLATDSDRPMPYLSPIAFKQLIPKFKSPDPPTTPLASSATDPAMISAGGAQTASSGAGASASPPEQPNAEASGSARENSDITVWSYMNYPRLIFQDAQGNIREANCRNNWKAEIVHLGRKARPGSPLQIVSWNSEARLFYVGADNKLMEKIFTAGSWVGGERCPVDTLPLHQDTKLGHFVSPSSNSNPLVLHIYFQQHPDGAIRLIRYTGTSPSSSSSLSSSSTSSDSGWSLDPRTFPAGAVGTSISSAFAGSSQVRLVYQLPDGHVGMLSSADRGRTFTPTTDAPTRLSATAPAALGSPLAGGAWNVEPRPSKGAEAIDQMRFFWRAAGTTTRTATNGEVDGGNADGANGGGRASGGAEGNKIVLFNYDAKKGASGGMTNGVDGRSELGELEVEGYSSGSGNSNRGGRLAYLTMRIGKQVCQRLYVQLASKELVEYCNDGESNSTWSKGQILPVTQ